MRVFGGLRGRVGVLSLQNLDKCANKTSPKSCHKIFHFYIPVPGRLPAALYTHVTSVKCVKTGTLPA